MRIPSNKIADIIRFFRDELKDIYEKEELEVIISYCFEEYIGIKRFDINNRANDTVNQSDLLKFNFAISDLKKHKPIQYVLGKADFYGLTFIVNEHVLIPRPETEELVDLIIKENQPSKLKPQISILDIGTGSGCIPISLKKNIPSANVYAMDVSEQALEVAKQNAITNNVAVEFILDDILKPNNLQLTTINYDIIVSNPPYICISEKEQMQKNVLDHEPHLALFVGDNDALLFYKTIADFALQHLKPNGKLYFEVNQLYGEDVALMLESKGFKKVQLLKDLNDRNRIVKAMI